MLTFLKDACPMKQLQRLEGNKNKIIRTEENHLIGNIVWIYEL